MNPRISWLICFFPVKLTFWGTLILREAMTSHVYSFYVYVFSQRFQADFEHEQLHWIFELKEMRPRRNSDWPLWALWVQWNSSPWCILVHFTGFTGTGHIWSQAPSWGKTGSGKNRSIGLRMTAIPLPADKTPHDFVVLQVPSHIMDLSCAWVGLLCQTPTL